MPHTLHMHTFSVSMAPPRLMPMLLPFGEAHQPYSPCKPPRPVAKFERMCDDASCDSTAENFDRYRDRTRFCVSVTVNMLLRITYNSSLTVDDFLTVQNGLHCLTIITRERCQCDCSLVFARVTAERGTASLPPSPHHCRLAFCAVISSRISPMLRYNTNALERKFATCQCNNRSQAIEVTVESFL